MNKEQFQGQWNQIKGKVKEKWGKLTDDDITVINGKREQLVGTLQKKYGIEKEKVEKEISEFEKQFDTKDYNTSQEDVDVDQEMDFEKKYSIESDERRDRRKTGTEDF
jgi:uncharacterized protein YjbJ (UPF0337 family)